MVALMSMFNTVINIGVHGILIGEAVSIFLSICSWLHIVFDTLAEATYYS